MTETGHDSNHPNADETLQLVLDKLMSLSDKEFRRRLDSVANHPLAKMHLGYFSEEQTNE